MLQDKYLPDPDYSIVDSIELTVPPAMAGRRLETVNFHHSWIIRLLFTLRGLPVPDVLSLAQLESSMFVRLERIDNQELILGLIGKPWTTRGGIVKFIAEEFTGFEKPDFAKATWSFAVQPAGDGSRLITETRVKTTSKDALRKFSFYWFFIRPFSKLIRQEILRSMKKACEAPSSEF